MGAWTVVKKVPCLVVQLVVLWAAETAVTKVVSWAVNWAAR